MATSETTVERARPPERAHSFWSRVVSGDEVARLIALLAATTIVFITVWVGYEL